MWCLLLSAGFLFTPLRSDSLLTLQFTLFGKQDSALCVGFASSWHGDRPPTKPDDNAQQPQQTRPTKLPIRANRVQNIKERNYEDSRGQSHKGAFLQLKLLEILKTTFTFVFAFIRNTIYLFLLYIVLLWFPWWTPGYVKIKITKFLKLGPCHDTQSKHTRASDIHHDVNTSS